MSKHQLAKKMISAVLENMVVKLATGRSGCLFVGK